MRQMGLNGFIIEQNFSLPAVIQFGFRRAT
jgi:hypothetical protein